MNLQLEIFLYNLSWDIYYCRVGELQQLLATHNTIVTCTRICPVQTRWQGLTEMLSPR